MPLPRIAIVPGPSAGEVADLLRRHDTIDVTAAGGREPAALVVAVGPADEFTADVILDPAAPLADQVARLWSDRLAPLTEHLADRASRRLGSPVLRPHDPARLVTARRLLRRLSDGLAGEGLDDGSWTYDHIGSTSVPGLLAKPFVDLQLGVSDLPAEGSPMDEVLWAAGFVPEPGARPDSPGVYRDHIADPGLAPARMYRKRLYLRPDPGQVAILHVRLLGSPWWSYTVLFRDWLRTDADGRAAYQEAKQRAAAEHANDADEDDYTRAKAGFLHRVRSAYERHGTASPYRVRR
ncbi:MAG TPA: GrpB family protein [Pseudonocardiaceae bacterium]|nr:GrpB family protein [Pseudonocardiaceae bacterium]